LRIHRASRGVKTCWATRTGSLGCVRPDAHLRDAELAGLPKTHGAHVLRPILLGDSLIESASGTFDVSTLEQQRCKRDCATTPSCDGRFLRLQDANAKCGNCFRRRSRKLPAPLHRDLEHLRAAESDIDAFGLHGRQTAAGLQRRVAESASWRIQRGAKRRYSRVGGRRTSAFERRDDTCRRPFGESACARNRSTRSAAKPA